MSKIQAFKGIRPRPDTVEKVASPPYDVLNSEEARAMVRGNPYSFLRVVKAEVDLDPSADLHGDAVYEQSRKNLDEMIRAETLVQDLMPCYYIYEQRMGEHVQRGLMAGVSADEYEKGLIKKHEFTRRDKEDDRAKHVDVLNANTGPVMLTYRATAEIDALVEGICTDSIPVFDFVADDGIGHRLWVVSGLTLVARFEALFGDIDALYVADGHHRSAAGFRVRNLRRDRNPEHTGDEPYNYYLAVLFPDDQLAIQGYYRAVKDLNGMTSEAFLARVAESFDLRELGEGEDALPTALHHITMRLDGRWVELTAKAGTFDPSDPVGSMDAAILQEKLLAPVLGVEDPRSDARIDFIGGIRGTVELERRCDTDMRVAFALYPVAVSQLMAIADANAVMPPKSTWFEPKLRSGMVTRSLDG
jgi:uncharacterized protein (DUF1015 family)